jgi:hypothetical protein
MFETGYFASLWRDVALKLGLAEWRRPWISFQTA